MSGPSIDPWLDAQIDAAVAPYVGRLPESEIAWMRSRLAEALVNEPRGAELVRRARPRGPVDSSGEVVIGASGAASSPPLAKTGGRGRAG